MFNYCSVPILTFHKVDSTFEWGVTRVTPFQFKTILRFLKNEGYETISLRTLCDPDTTKPLKPIIITFDDAYESVFTSAFPLMQEFGFLGTVFVISGYVGQLNEWDVNLGWRKFRHLSWDQIRELSKCGFEIGSHTVHHPDLTRLDSHFLYRELQCSKMEIEDKIAKEVIFISFPFGKYNKEIIKVCRSIGYRRGCGYYQINSYEKDSKETFVLERRAYYLFDRLWNLKAKLGDNDWTFFENLKLRIVNFCSHGTALVKSYKCDFDFMYD